ncbi:Thioredoxin domain protein (plasmid) [Spirosoma linguale DSM 74]|uniref:Thioredoxin domain protein n=2 Tax=Spirosoma TaxID=107 RepID=D2QVX2_SPILD|nr:Thioredoxin domain protein [Spirosoma linguale DSM 74]
MLRHLFLRGLMVGLITLLYTQTVYAITFFQGSLQEAHQKSKQEHKRLLIYFTAKWCGPCRYMEKEVFNTDSVTQITDAQFVALKVDYDAWNTKPIVEKYRVASLPSFVIVDSLDAVEKRALGRVTTAEFIRFLAPTTVQVVERPIFELRSDEQRYTQRQLMETKGQLELGLQAGVNLTPVSSLTISHQLGYDISLLLIWTKRRMSIRSGLSLVSIGAKSDDGQPLRFHYVAFPVNLSYLLRKTVVLGLPGGYRANLTPYICRLINNPDLAVSSLDYGTKLGLSAFVGSTSRLEAQLGYQLGMKDIGGPSSFNLYNRGLYFCVTFIL